ncbi:MAG TPA: hypothetical protein VFD92_24450 [Candidatus Binatia bacterium]|nr:hypothetical protein [Candidatus Binatia bacterium]
MTDAAPRGGSRVAPAAAAAAAYVALALFTLRAVAPAPRTLLPYPFEAEKHGVLALDRSDQAFSVRAIADNAHRLTTAPWTILEGGMCRPLARSYTLGEHALGEGLLAALPWALTRDPIATFNAVAVAALVVPALAMYALGAAWTGSAAAAFVAGLLFAFHPGRLVHLSKPYLVENAWTPLLLLFTHRLFVRGRWRDAALVAVFGGLQLLASFYQVIGAALLVGAFGSLLAIARRRAIAALLPKLAVVATALAALAALLFAPYLETRRMWEVLQGRMAVFFYPSHFFAPRGPAYPGTIALLLAVVGVADRARRRAAPGADPRLPLAGAGLFVVWCLSTGIALPGARLVIPSPLAVAAAWLPGIDAVRALPLARFAWLAAVTALAAYGARAVLRAPARAGGRAALAAAVVALALVDVAWPPAARVDFLEEPVVRAARARPSDEELAVYRAVPEGDVVDVPMRSGASSGGALAAVPALRAGAWHLRPIAACYGSFTTPVADDVAALVERLPAPDAADGLAALGFRSALVHESLLTPAERDRLAPWLAGLDPRAPLLASAPGLSLHALPPPPATTEDVAVLVPGSPVAGGAPLPGDLAIAPSREAADATVEVLVRNPSATMFRHPSPIAPRRVRVRWRAPDGTIAVDSFGRLLLPLALPPGGVARRTVRVEAVPTAPGTYDVEVAPTSDPDRPLARGRAVREP